jgi:hypothetical protein
VISSHRTIILKTRKAAAKTNTAMSASEFERTGQSPEYRAKPTPQ